MRDDDETKVVPRVAGSSAPRGNGNGGKTYLPTWLVQLFMGTVVSGLVAFNVWLAKENYAQAAEIRESKQKIEGLESLILRELKHVREIVDEVRADLKDHMRATTGK